jgi:hypothetical protein
METHLPDGTIVETFKDYLNSDGVEGVRHLVRRSDFSVISIDQLGEIKIASSNCRSALNENNGRLAMG